MAHEIGLMFEISAFKLLQATATAIASLACPAIVRAAGETPMKVVIAAYGCMDGASCKAHSAGFQLAVDEINAAGGILAQVEIVIGNSKTEPRIVVEQANRLVREEKVDFLAGTFSSAERNAAGPWSPRRKKCCCIPPSTRVRSRIHYPGVCNANIFMFGPEPTQQVWPHMEDMIKKFGNKFFMIGSDYVWPRVTNEFTKEKLRTWAAVWVGEAIHPVQYAARRSALSQMQYPRPTSFSIR